MTKHSANGLDGSPLRVLMATSETVPFSKTGGLADVTTALTKALSKRGVDVSLFVPNHRNVPNVASRAGLQTHDSGLEFDVQVGKETISARILWSEFPDSRARIFLIDQPELFDRPGLYGEGHDYEDNCRRFTFYSRAVMEAARKLVLRPDVVHCNDWQTGLIPALLDAEYRGKSGFESTASLMTIHNLAYQGQFWHLDMNLTGLGWELFNWRQMESHGQLNLLKTGIAFADRINTVSPTYAKEIQTEEFGHGLESVLQYHREKLSGILNGIDSTEWNPATDSSLIQNYDVDSFADGKAKCKAALQERFGLPVDPKRPLFGMISRMSEQKGFDIICEAADRFLEHDIQLCILGTGDPHYEFLSRTMAERYPGKVAVSLQFDESLAHQIEAGSDVFLMPSRYEPCGLNQMYSLTYGTVPLVRRVGGLADSVVDATPANVLAGTATGFVFHDYTADALVETFSRVVKQYEEDRNAWNRIVRTGMQQDWSWDRSADQYLGVYRDAIASRS